MSALDIVFTPYPHDAVQRGAALLDEKVPGWRKETDASYPLGQVRVHYANAMRKAGLRPWVAGHPVTYGFAAPRLPLHNDHALQDAWREELIGGAR